MLNRISASVNFQQFNNQFKFMFKQFKNMTIGVGLNINEITKRTKQYLT